MNYLNQYDIYLYFDPNIFMLQAQARIDMFAACLYMYEWNIKITGFQAIYNELTIEILKVLNLT